jgi:hypothetical protein
LYDEYYRREAWAFMLSGGALYNHLDYSFAVGKEDGTNIVRKPTPGGGSPALRRQIGVMKRFLEQFDFVRMRPLDAESIKGLLSADCKAYMLAEDSRQYAIYGTGKVRNFSVMLPAGKYRTTVLNPINGTYSTKNIAHTGGNYVIEIQDSVKLYDEIAVGFIKED